MMDDWISVNDRLPETCKPVLVWLHWGFQDDECTVAEYWGDSNSSPGWGELNPYVTHWMPLPGGPGASRTITVSLSEDAVFLLQNYPHVINDLAARTREALISRLDDAILYGREESQPEGD